MWYDCPYNYNIDGIVHVNTDLIVPSNVFSVGRYSTIKGTTKLYVLVFNSTHGQSVEWKFNELKHAQEVIDKFSFVKESKNV